MRRYLLPGSLALIIFVSLAVGYSYITSFQYLIISDASGISSKVYKATGGDYGYDATSTPLAIATNSSNKLKLKKGTYVVVTEAGSEYEAASYPVTLDKEKVDLSVSPNYTGSKLDSLLVAVKPALEQAIKDKYPSVNQYYKFGAEKLYQKGDWAGVKLEPLDIAKFDTLRVVLRKQGSVWTLTSGPPVIVISSPLHQDIPKDVLSDVNNFL